MTVNKGLSTLVDISPNFSDQTLENAVNSLKLGWVTKSFELDSVIASNGVLSLSQKNDLKDTINNVSYLNLGRVLGDLLRHTKSIIDGSILPDDSGVAGTFTEILGNVSALDGLIPFFYGVSAADKQRGVNDHLGTLNNVLLTSQDSTQPAFTMLSEAITYIVDSNRSQETALETAYDNLKAFINSVVADSTDFQQTLNTFATAVATAHSNFNTALASEPYLTKRNQLFDGREKINSQVSLENSNLTGIRTYLQSLVDVQTYTSLANNKEMADLLAKVAQAPKWVTYYEDYSKNLSNINPIFNTNTDSDKSAIIDQVLNDSGLPDVTDSTDFDAVADKARRDSRIDTSGYDRLTVEAQITKSCDQLGITTSNRTINSQSVSLLNNMNKHDRDEIANRLDLNESSNTYT